MDKPIYNPGSFPGYEEAIEDLVSDNLKLVSDTILGISLYSGDYEFTSTVISNYIYHDTPLVRGYAMMALGHLARVHSRLPDELPVIEIVEEGLNSGDPAMQGCSESTAEHIYSDVPDIGKKIQACPLSLAVMNNNEREVRRLLLKGDALNKTNFFLEGPLHHAAYYGYDNLVKRLLFSGCLVDLTNQHGETPLRQAVKNGHIECVKSLLSYNADPNFKDYNGLSPLHVSCVANKIGILKLFIQKLNLTAQGLDENASTYRGNILHIAACYSHTEILEYLLDLGMDVNKAESDGQWTPLHYAYIDNKPDIIALLLKYGADLNLKDDTGKTPLDIALEEQCIQESNLEKN